eukprot:CAMPEP_0116544130 /NCGR_PEP_ID=MMETSP0397-20121206/1944_1 /TAXON_ID=216820 /ORGANISM="Cyclophora tenuis, Strain ECT3854" /LENGTH=279 /DNA_ID=CAMNT_0004068303 /DNA_START=515 /DNA_END=1354 /DNA_ORIENTATION=-
MRRLEDVDKTFPVSEIHDWNRHDGVGEFRISRADGTTASVNITSIVAGWEEIQEEAKDIGISSALTKTKYASLVTAQLPSSSSEKQHAVAIVVLMNDMALFITMDIRGVLSPPHHQVELKNPYLKALQEQCQHLDSVVTTTTSTTTKMDETWCGVKSSCECQESQIVEEMAQAAHVKHMQYAVNVCQNLRSIVLARVYEIVRGYDSCEELLFKMGNNNRMVVVSRGKSCMKTIVSVEALVNEMESRAPIDAEYLDAVMEHDKHLNQLCQNKERAVQQCC